MDLGGVVPVSPEVPLNHIFERTPYNIRPGESSGIEEHFTNVLGECIPIPDAEAVELVPAKEEAFETQRREEMIDRSNPLGHADVIGVFRLEGKLKESSVGSR